MLGFLIGDLSRRWEGFGEHGAISNDPNVLVDLSSLLQIGLEVIVDLETARKGGQRRRRARSGRENHEWVFSSCCKSLIESMRGLGASPVLHTSMPKGTAEESSASLPPFFQPSLTFPLLLDLDARFVDAGDMVVVLDRDSLASEPLGRLLHKVGVEAAENSRGDIVDGDSSNRSESGVVSKPVNVEWSISVIASGLLSGWARKERSAPEQSPTVSRR